MIESLLRGIVQDCRASPARALLNRLRRRRRRRLDQNENDECPFRCDNGNCRAVDVVCSGKDGCGDGSDEENCQICSE